MLLSQTNPIENFLVFRRFVGFEDIAIDGIDNNSHKISVWMIIKQI